MSSDDRFYSMDAASQSSSRYHHYRPAPLTLGRSLQLVTSGGGAGLAAAEAVPSFHRRKKTVRFNSEDWGNGGNLDDCDYEHDLWMTEEDVRSGRWHRWDSLRQESQESQTRDSGIETGSCFTSSEDSNRGDHQSKKVEALTGSQESLHPGSVLFAVLPSVFAWVSLPPSLHHARKHNFWIICIV